MTWRIEIALRVRIGREAAKPNASDESSSSSSESREVETGALVERSDQPAAMLAPPIGFRPAPEDARRSDTAPRTPQREP